MPGDLPLSALSCCRKETRSWRPEHECPAQLCGLCGNALFSGSGSPLSPDTIGRHCGGSRGPPCSQPVVLQGHQDPRSTADGSSHSWGLLKALTPTHRCPEFLSNSVLSQREHLRAARGPAPACPSQKACLLLKRAGGQDLQAAGLSELEFMGSVNKSPPSGRL